MAMLKVGQHVTSCVMQQTTTISARLPDRDRPVHCSATDAVSRANSISGQNILQFKAFSSSWIISAQPALEVFEGPEGFWCCPERWGLSENLQWSMIKTEMGCTPPKTYQSQNFFLVPPKKSPNTFREGEAISFLQKYVFVKHPPGIWLMLMLSQKTKNSFGNF